MGVRGKEAYGQVRTGERWVRDVSLSHECGLFKRESRNDDMDTGAAIDPMKKSVETANRSPASH